MEKYKTQGENRYYTEILEQPTFKMNSKEGLKIKQMLVKYEQRTLIEEGLKIINS